MSLSPKNHWIALRATAIAAIPLSLWFVYSIVHISGTDYGTFTAWLKQPLNAGLLILFILVTFWHASLGIHEIIEDYMHGKIKNISLKVKVAIFAVLALICIVAVVKISANDPASANATTNSAYSLRKISGPAQAGTETAPVVTPEAAPAPAAGTIIERPEYRHKKAPGSVQPQTDPVTNE